MNSSRTVLFGLLMTVGLNTANAASTESEAIGMLSGSPIEINGSTLFPALVLASIEVIFGDQTATGTTDSTGNYSITIDCNDNEAMVFVIVQGIAEQAHIRAARVVDSCAALNAAADQSGSFQVGPVSPVSTALFAVLNWYVERSLILEWPPSASDIHQHRYAVSGFLAGGVASVLPSMNAGLWPLPPGFDNTLDVLLDRQAYLEYRTDLFAQVDLEVFNAARQETAWSAQLNAGTDELSQQDSFRIDCQPIGNFCPMAMLSENGQDFFHVGGHTSGLAEVLFRALQDVIFADNHELPVDNLRALRMSRPDGEPLTESMSFFFVPGIGQVETWFYLDYIDWRLVNASEAIPLASTVDHNRRVHPNGELPNTASSSEFPSLISVVSDSASLPAWQGPTIGDAWHVPLHFGWTPEVATNSAFRWDRLNFASDGAGQTALTELNFTWSMSDGALHVDLPPLGMHHFRLLGGDMDRHPLFEAVFEPASPDVRSEFKAMIQDNAPPAFSTESAPGRYIGGFDLDELRLLPNTAAPVAYLVFQLDTGGTGWRASMTDPQITQRPTNAIDIDWSVDATGRLVTRMESTPDFFQHRAWLPMRLHEGTGDLYVLELGPFSNDDSDYQFPNIPGRLNFYRRIDPTE